MHYNYDNYSITFFYRYSYQLASLPITPLIYLFVVLSSSFSKSFSSFSSICLSISTAFSYPYHYVRRWITGRNGVRYY